MIYIYIFFNRITITIFITASSNKNYLKAHTHAYRLKGGDSWKYFQLELRSRKNTLFVGFSKILLLFFYILEWTPELAKLSWLIFQPIGNCHHLIWCIAGIQKFKKCSRCQDKFYKRALTNLLLLIIFIVWTRHCSWLSTIQRISASFAYFIFMWWQ